MTMFCPNCGNPINEDSIFCPACGSNLTAPRAAEAEQTPVFVEPEQPAAENIPAEEAFSYTSFEEVPEKPKKKFGIGKIMIIVAAVAAAVGIAFSAKWIWNTVLKVVAPTEYTQNVEKEAVNNLASNVSAAYGRALKTYNEQVAAEMKIELEISDEVLDLLDGYLPEDLGIDLKMLNDLSLTYGFNMDDNLMQIAMMLQHKDQSVIGADVIMDIETQTVYLALKELSEYYLEISQQNGYYDDYYGTGYTRDYTQIQEVLDKIVEALPTEKELNDLLNRYAELIIENIEDVDKSTEKVKVDDISQSLTALEYEIDRKTVMKAAKAVLKEAKNDKDLKKIIIRVLETLAEEGAFTGMDMDPEEMYDQVKEGISYALEQLDEAEFENEELFTLTTYVNGKHEVVGRKIEIEEAGVEARYITVSKGQKFERELSFEMDNGYEEQSFEIVGAGTEKKGVENAVYTVTVNDETLVEIDVSDYKVEDSSVQGKIVIKPTDEVLENLMQSMDLSGTVQSLLKTAKPGISIEFSGNEKEVKYAIGLEARGRALAKITMTMKMVDAKEISLPADSKTINVYSADMQKYLNSINIDKIADICEELGLPEEILENLEEEFDSMLYYGGF